MLSKIIDYWKDYSAIKAEDSFITVNRNRKVKVTTKGWDVLVQYKDVSEILILLKYARKPNPLEIVEYNVSKELSGEPALVWWISQVLRTMRGMISRIKVKKLAKGRIRFGIDVPENINNDVVLDACNKNDLY